MNVAILGPGLLGGSIALAAKARGMRVAIWARRAETLDETRTICGADVVSTELREVVTGAELVILCVPIEAMGALSRVAATLLDARAVVTDVGSVKAPVVRELSAIFRGCAQFVGSHPMAGAEKAGIKFARADLCDGAVCIVTPDETSDPAAVELVSDFWRTIGCEVRTLAPAEHDEIVGLVSHFPHLLAATLVRHVADENARAFAFCGPGFRDTTRVASGPPAMWTEILRANRAAVRKSAEAMIEKLREITKLLDRSDAEAAQAMNDFLSQAKAARDRLRQPKADPRHG